MNYRKLSEVGRRLPSFRNNKPVHPATITRWILEGVRLQDGSRLKLAAKRLPGGWVVSDEAVAEFIDRLTRDRAGEPATSSPPPAPRRNLAHEIAEQQCAAIGL